MGLFVSLILHVKHSRVWERMEVTELVELRNSFCLLSLWLAALQHQQLPSDYVRLQDPA
uniref:Uncharacterized protein n=1 Tax=Rhizophora mucronata TaxID=61149 RepID=A0A2P2P740_RHIMU